jgi:hypothetical protein
MPSLPPVWGFGVRGLQDGAPARRLPAAGQASGGGGRGAGELRRRWRKPASGVRAVYWNWGIDSHLHLDNRHYEWSRSTGTLLGAVHWS